MAVEILERWKKKVPKKINFFRNDPALYPPTPLLMARPLREELFVFFAASLRGLLRNCVFYFN